MEEASGSMVSNPVLSIRESSDLDNVASSVHPPPKRCRLDSPPSSRFKGVVLQQNGHWGAQIYANHHRIWLGTFKSERSAALAYDRAAVKLQRPDPNPNLQGSSLAPHEPRFQDLHSLDAVLTMIRDGSYESNLLDFLRTHHEAPSPPYVRHGGGPSSTTPRQELFRKDLTPSDVGKLNRLVIPKKHAERHFPRIQAARGGDVVDVDPGESAEGMMLEFVDAQGHAWEFRYCYWKSSQSFVFTKGWNRFVRTKGLQARDVVSFYSCHDRDGRRKPLCMIDVRYHDGGDRVLAPAPMGRGDGWEQGGAGVGVGLCLGVGGNLFESSSVGLRRMREEDGKEEDEGEVVLEPVGAFREKKSFMLFGVQIGER